MAFRMTIGHPRPWPGYPRHAGLVSAFCTSNPRFRHQLSSDPASRRTPLLRRMVPVITAHRGLAPLECTSLLDTPGKNAYATMELTYMIAVLRGVLVEKHPNQAVVEVGGVGYDIHIPITTYTRLPEAGAEVRLRVYTHVREDTLALYGFFSQDEKTLFEKLIGVSGIGPSLAIKVLSGLAATELISAIRKGEVDRLVRIPGVGKKTAERMVLELRDKL